ncbi:trigger factor [Mycoplasmopsis hyopharyngis]|uniref:trigger factor n=1 Tax=Mycoplasmopsis hyopharyngis TaxID=29558 RepID=UPI003873C4FD
MTVKFDKTKAEILVSTEVESKEYQKLIEKFTEKEMTKIIVPGFRPGKAPREKLIKYLNFEKVNEQANREIFNKYSNPAFEEAKKENEYVQPIIIDASLNKKDEGSDKLLLTFTFPVFTYAENVKLGKTEIKMPEVKVSSKEVEARLDTKLKEYALLVPLKEKELTQLQDIVNIDFKGFVNDEAFEGGEAEGYDLELGSNSFIPGFEDQLVGKKVGWKGDIKVKFPKNYFSNHLKDKEAVFEITINSAKRRELSVNEEVIGSILKGATTVEQLKEYFKIELEKEKLIDSLNTTVNQYIEEVIAKNKFVIHAEQIKNIIEFNEKELEKKLKEQGVKKSEYLELLGKTEKELQEELIQTSEKTFSTELVTYALREKHKIEISDEKIEAKYVEISKEWNIEIEQLKTFLPKERISNDLYYEAFTEAIVKGFDKEGFEKYKKSIEANNTKLHNLLEKLNKKEEKERTEKVEKTTKKSTKAEANKTK